VLAPPGALSQDVGEVDDLRHAAPTLT